MYKRPARVLLLYHNIALDNAILRQIACFDNQPELELRALQADHPDAQSCGQWADLLICLDFEFSSLDWQKPPQVQLKHWKLTDSENISDFLEAKIINIINGIRLLGSQ